MRWKLKFSFVVLVLIVQIIKTKKEDNKEPVNSIYEFAKDYSDITDTTEIKPGKIYQLNDASFDSYIRNGRNYKWFVIFYVKTCGHCKRARQEILKVVPKVDKPEVRFAEVDTEGSVMTSVRFNVTRIPYIVLIHKEKMYELNKYASVKNLIEFINTTFSNVKDELQEIPNKVTFLELGLVMAYEAAEALRMNLQRVLYYYGINFELKIIHLMIGALIILIGFGYFEYKIISKCCSDELDPEILKRLQEEKFEEEEEFEEGEEEKKESKKGKDDKDDKDNKENTSSEENKEKEMIAKEIQKENEMKEKENLENQNNEQEGFDKDKKEK